MAKQRNRERVTLAEYRQVCGDRDRAQRVVADAEARIEAARKQAAIEADRLEELEEQLIKARGLLTSAAQALRVAQQPTILGNAISRFLRFNEANLGPSPVQAALECSRVEHVSRVAGVIVE